MDASPTRERRVHARVKTLREALFEVIDGWRPWRTGVAQDISLSGLLIRTFHPESAGTYLEIELSPKPEDPASTAVRVRGRVVRATPLEDGAFAMGVRLHVPPLRRTSLALLPEPDRLVRHMADLIRTLHRGSLFSLAFAEQALADGTRPVAYGLLEREDKGERRRRRRLWPLLGLLLLLLLLFGVQPMTVGLRWAAHPGVPRISAYGFPESKPFRPGYVSPRTGRITENEGPRRLAHAQGGVFAQRGLERGVDSPAVLRKEGVSRELAPRSIADISYAWGLAAQGDTAPALAMLHKVLSSPDEAPEAWRAVALELRTALLGTGAGPVRVEPFQPAVALQRDEQDDGFTEFTIVIDRQSYVLTVSRGGVPVHTFPVGLGKDNATPAGDFRIANRIRNPDWYNRGEAVPAGDARNPLGAYWMGLGANGRATSYGIHPTDEPDSIGRNLSRGCIRMRPEDAEVLFDLCPVGTHVRICD